MLSRWQRQPDSHDLHTLILACSASISDHRKFIATEDRTIQPHDSVHTGLAGRVSLPRFRAAGLVLFALCLFALAWSATPASAARPATPSELEQMSAATRAYWAIHNEDATTKVVRAVVATKAPGWALICEDFTFSDSEYSGFRKCGIMRRAAGNWSVAYHHTLTTGCAFLPTIGMPARAIDELRLDGGQRCSVTRFPSRGIKPKKFCLGSNFCFRNVKWTKWSEKKAIGRGIHSVSNPSGYRAKVRRTITLDRPTSSVFTRARWRHADGHPGMSMASLMGGRTETWWNWVIQR